jgi:hypothetical protein
MATRVDAAAGAAEQLAIAQLDSRPVEWPPSAFVLLQALLEVLLAVLRSTQQGLSVRHSCLCQGASVAEAKFSS